MPVDLRANAGNDEVDLGKINWTLKQFRLDELTDYYKNPRSLSEKEFKQLKTSLDKFGMIDKPIVNADSANTIIGGHQRKHVLEASGVKECECWVPDRELTAKEVEELNIRLNKNTGSWDFDTLANEFELDDLLEWGFDKGELDLDLWASDAPEDVEPQIDKAEELREKWGVESGQLWQLGEHRLICGDCTDKAVVERVMGGEKAELAITDPPYNYDFDYGIASDNLSLDEYESFVRNWWAVARKNSNRLVVTPGLKNLDFYYRNFEITWTCAWVKKNAMTASKIGNLSVWEPVLFESDEWDWEPVIVHGKARKKVKRDVYEYPIKIQQGTGGHPCPKLLEFWEKLISDFSSIDNTILDVFLGSGTTLIACERLGRKCRAVEISPAYVAVAIQRWVDVTGKEPMLLTL